MAVFFVIVLVCAWLGYFFYPFKDSRSDWQKRNSTAAFDRGIGALSGSGGGFGASSSTEGKRMLFNLPRSSYEAGRRRQKVIAGLTVISLVSLAISLLSLVFSPIVGVASLFVLFLAAASLLSLLCASANLRHRSAEQEMRSLILNHDSPTMPQNAVAHAQISPRQVVTR